MRSRESRRRAAVHISELLRPAQPTGSRVQGRAKITIERIKARMHLQEFAAGGSEGAEIPRPRGPGCQMPIAEIAIQQLENFEFEVRHASVVDQFTEAQFAKPLRDRRIG